MQCKMAGVLVPRCIPWARARVGLCAWVLALMTTVCIGAHALDRDRKIGQFYSTFWSEKDGAPTRIRALAQSSDGFLWIASEKGLFRFDGVRFERYEPPSGVRLPSYSIYSFMPTPDGGLWIAFEPNGLGFYKDGSLKVFSQEELRPATPIHCFARDDDGTIWAGTEDGLELRRDNRWIPVGSDWNFTPERVRYLFVDRAGTLWVATDKQVVYLKRGAKRFEVSGPVGSNVTTLSEARNGRVWFADNGSNGPNIVRPVPTNDLKLSNSGPAIVAEGLSDLLFDRDGALWITRLDSGLIRIRDPEKLEPRKYGPQDPALESFGPKDGFPAGSAYKMLEDREGNIWVGCSNGLIRFRHSQILPITLPQRYERLTLLAGQHGQLWVGTTYDKPLLKISGESIVSEKGGNAVSSVLPEANGDIWWEA